mmetsp:Transcript_4403/g.11997  ORF Transcript_4403/g.11997 Transcript_4403/m.11997 type:complete len:274 (+) Transcript_4403:64-885(+)
MASASPEAAGPRLVAFPFEEEKPEGWIRFACFSDTHGLHGDIPKDHCPSVDVLLHAGDFTNTGEVEQVRSFAEWLQNYPAAQKIVIAGNHDVTFETEYYERMWRRYHLTQYNSQEARSALIDSGCCTYLEDELVEALGYRIFGSPWQPEFCGWAFNLPLGEECRRAWSRIPRDVDILMTHGPPHGVGDLCDHGARVGCPDLLEAIRSRAVSVSLAGHIHEDYGARQQGGTLYINASTCTLRYRPTNPPIVFDLPPPRELREAAVAAARAVAGA